MFAVPLSEPERQLRLREVAVGRRDEAAVERVAVHQQRGLRARHGQRQAVPGAVGQPEGEALHARARLARRHVVQPHLVAAPARLHLQVPAHAPARVTAIHRDRDTSDATRSRNVSAAPERTVPRYT